MHAGSDKAVTQLEAGKAIFDLAGYVSFLLWRSVYVTKQVRTPSFVCLSLAFAILQAGPKRHMPLYAERHHGVYEGGDSLQSLAGSAYTS